MKYLPDKLLLISLGVESVWKRGAEKGVERSAGRRGGDAKMDGKWCREERIKWGGRGGRKGGTEREGLDAIR